jgi:hypothetical protein
MNRTAMVALSTLSQTSKPDDLGPGFRGSASIVFKVMGAVRNAPTIGGDRGGTWESSREVVIHWIAYTDSLE